MALHTHLRALQHQAFILPTITAASWLAMLGALFGSWYNSGQPRYISEEDTQNIAFISDIGAQSLKPVFITCTSIAMITYMLSIVLYFYYLNPDVQQTDSSLSFSASLSSTYTNTKPHESSSWISPQSLWTRFSIPFLSTLFSLLGATNLILLTIFDTARYTAPHRILLPTSIISHILGCIILCIWSALRLHQHRVHQSTNSGPLSGDKFTVELYAPAGLPVSMGSLVVKSVIVAIEFGLVALFGVTTWALKTFDTAAVMEWVVVLMFAGYMVCLIVDLWVLRTRSGARDFN